ncbi:hypothetical protein EBZ35_08980, partial [bacterium]|nr:hypothetical protein [bacterium]
TGTNTNLTFAGAGNISISSTGLSIGSGVLTKTGSGLLALSVNNTYTGGTTLTGGTIQMAATAALGSSGNITFGGGALQYGSGISTDISSRIKNSSSAILIDTNGQSVTYANSIDSTNVGGLTKNGSGTLILSGSNAYNGTTTVNVGTLQISNSNALGLNATGTIVSSGATLDLSGNINVSGESLTLSGNGMNGMGAIRNSSGSNILSQSSAITLSGDTTLGSDSGLFRITGAGINGTNTNLTFVGAGDFRVDRAMALGTGNLTMSGTGNLSIAATIGSTYTGNTTILNGSIIYLGNNALSDTTTVVINGGTLNIGNWTDTVGSVNLTNGNISGTTGVLTVNSSIGSYSMQNGTVTAILAGTANLTKTGTGTLTLNGNNT